MSSTHGLAARLRSAAIGVALAATALGAGAQFLTEPDRNWQEGAVPPPPAYHTNQLIELEVPHFSSVKLGIDPQSISVDRKAGVVRYVVVARGPAAVNAMYEGIRCTTGEYRVYAHQVQGGDWVDNTQSEWKPMSGAGGIMVQHPYQLAHNGLCMGTTLRASVRDMVQELRTSNASLYR